MPIALLIALLLTGCVSVEPWEREIHGKPCMNVALDGEGIIGEYNAKLFEVKTAGGLPGSAPGGGCGCTQ